VMAWSAERISNDMLSQPWFSNPPCGCVP